MSKTQSLPVASTYSLCFWEFATGYAVLSGQAVTGHKSCISLFNFSDSAEHLFCNWSTLLQLLTRASSGHEMV